MEDVNVEFQKSRAVRVGVMPTGKCDLSLQVDFISDFVCLFVLFRNTHHCGSSGVSGHHLYHPPVHISVQAQKEQSRTEKEEHPIALGIEERRKLLTVTLPAGHCQDL